jgi:hypothetical protein
VVDDPGPARPLRAGPARGASQAGDESRHPEPGEGLVNLDFAGTGLLVGTSAGAAVLPGSFGSAHAVVSIGAFAIGVAAFLWAYALGIARSRTDLIGIGGLFFLAGGAAPRVIAFRLRIALAVQIVAVVVAASVRPFTIVAFGILAPMLGLGLMALWGGRHGTFPARDG